MENITFDMTPDEAFTLFISLLNREAPIFNREKVFRKNLLTRLWKISGVRRREESLWHQVFRGKMDEIGIDYVEDLNKFGIPLILENDEDNK